MVTEEQNRQEHKPILSFRSVFEVGPKSELQPEAGRHIIAVLQHRILETPIVRKMRFKKIGFGNFGRPRAGNAEF